MVTSAVYLNNSIGDWIRTTVGVRQVCVLSPTLFNYFLERIMTGALNDHEGTVSIGKKIINLHFADDIDGLAGREQELANLVARLDKDFYSLWHADQCREDQTDDQQHQWHQHWHQGQRRETRLCQQVQIPGSNHCRWRIQTCNSRQDRPDHSSGTETTYPTKRCKTELGNPLGPTKTS